MLVSGKGLGLVIFISTAKMGGKCGCGGLSLLELCLNKIGCMTNLIALPRHFESAEGLSLLKLKQEQLYYSRCERGAWLLFALVHAIQITKN